VIRRAPRLNVRSWIAHWIKTRIRVWSVMRYKRWIKAQMSHAGKTSNLHTEDIGHRRRAANHGERSLPLYLSHSAVNEEFNSSYVAALV